jgi:hypothetical protein
MGMVEMDTVYSNPGMDRDHEERLYRNYLLYTRIRTRGGEQFRKIVGRAMAKWGRALMRYGYRLEAPRGYIHG